ncbi:MAG: hypothetical protein JWP91_2601 [Fibrobacteres bacterium]|nr:hypothetical protein [Fibrobacterota bacterium]
MAKSRHPFRTRILFASILLHSFLLITAAGAKDKDKTRLSSGSAASGLDARKDMRAMVDTSKAGCKATSDTLDRLLITFTEARKSDDKAKMKAALERAEAHVFAMKAEMSQCVNRMDLMGGMMAEKKSAPVSGP